MAPGIKIYIQSGTDIHKETKAVSEGPVLEADIGKWIETTLDQKFFIVVLPEKDSVETEFEF